MDSICTNCDNNEMSCNNVYSVALCKTCEKKINEINNNEINNNEINNNEINNNEINNNETINNDNKNDYDSIATDISGSLSLSETNTDIDSDNETNTDIDSNNETNNVDDFFIYTNNTYSQYNIYIYALIILGVGIMIYNYNNK